MDTGLKYMDDYVNSGEFDKAIKRMQYAEDYFKPVDWEALDKVMAVLTEESE